MRVLDVDSGGDVAFLAAELVGAMGEIVGADRAPAAAAAARRRAAEKSLHNVSFRAGDPSEVSFERPFDAASGGSEASPLGGRGVGRHSHSKTWAWTSVLAGSKTRRRAH